MSAVFDHAIRYEFLPQGMKPITLVHQSAKRMRVQRASTGTLIFSMLLKANSRITLEIYTQAMSPENARHKPVW